MNWFRKGLITASFLATLGASLFSPIVPAGGAYTFSASEGGRGCVVTQESRQTPYSWIRKRIDGYDKSENAGQRVVRIYEDNWSRTRFGTSYVLDDGFVLTANHVTADMKTFFVTDEKRYYRGRVLASDPTMDLSLVGVKIDGQFGPTRIGSDPKPNEIVTMRTLNPNDSRYVNGSKSRMDLPEVKYDWKISPESQNSIRELQKRKGVLQSQLDEFGRRIDALYEPYLTHSRITDSEKKDLPTEHAINFSPPGTKKLDSKNMLHYMPKTDRDQFIPGMSGSGVFNKRGELVGVAVINQVSGYASGTMHAFGVPESMPEDVIAQIRQIYEEEGIVDGQINEIDSAIYRVENPPTEGAVSPQAIKSFLKGYCNSG